MDDNVAVVRAINAYAQLSQSHKRRQAICTLKKTLNLGIALGEATEHQSPMRNRFVPGDRSLAVNASTRLNDVARCDGRHQATARG
jgi:hypothetical protein